MLQAREQGLKLSALTDPARNIFFDKLLVLLSTIEGLTAPAPGTKAYAFIKAEVFNLCFAQAGYANLTEAEVVTALRINAEADPGARVESYNTVSRRFLAGVLNNYLTKKSETLQKWDADRALQPPAAPPPADVKARALEDLLWMQWADFKAGVLNLWYLYPPLYDLLKLRLKPAPELSLWAGCLLRLRQLEELVHDGAVTRAYYRQVRDAFHKERRIYADEVTPVQENAKRAWLLDFFTDLRDYGVDLKQII